MSDDKRSSRRRRAGRPDLLTDEVQRTIVGALRLGHYMETAAALAGVNKDTVYGWLKRGARVRAGRVPPSKQTDFDKRAAAFSDAVSRAMAEAESILLGYIARAAAEDWRAAAWRLERRAPERWGRRVVDVDVTTGGEPLREERGRTILVFAGSAEDDPELTPRPGEYGPDGQPAGDAE